MKEVKLMEQELRNLADRRQKIETIKLIAQLITVIKANHLTEINLNDNNIKDADVITLAKALKYNQSVVTLNIKNGEIKAAGTRALCKMLKKNQTLTRLNLKKNKIGFEGAYFLSEALKVNRTLTYLNLKRNYLGSQGTLVLSDMLKVNQTLHYLNLEKNQITQEGIQALGDMLKVNRTLTHLKLKHNGIGPKEAAIILNTLKSNPTLMRLNCDKRNKKSATHKAIKKVLKANQHQVENTRNLTLLTALVLLRHANSEESKLPIELWIIIINQLDFPSKVEGYRTSKALVHFLTQANSLEEINQRLQSKQDFRLVETHNTRVNQSRFSFLTPFKSTFSSAAQPSLAKRHLA